MAPPRKPAKDRLIENIVVVDSACWIWVGSRYRNGYGKMTYGFLADGTRCSRTAHSVSYETFVGPVASGLELDHLCRERACINWRHLEAVTSRENTLRGVGPAAANARKEICGKCGGPFSRTPRGQRRCRDCRANWQRSYDEKRRAIPRLAVEGASNV